MVDGDLYIQVGLPRQGWMPCPRGAFVLTKGYEEDKDSGLEPHNSAGSMRVSSVPMAEVLSLPR